MKYFLSALLIFLLIGCGEEQGDRAMGVVERDRIVLSAPASEPIRMIAVEEGQPVQAGDLLLQLDDRHALAVVEQKRASLDLARAQLDQVQSGARREQLSAARAAVQAARAQADEADKRYQRIKTLYGQNVANKAELDAARAQKDQSAAQLAQANQQWLELKNGARSEEVAQAEAQVRLAQAELDYAKQSLDDLTLVAPESGVVDILPWQQGDRIAAGVQLITLLSDKRTYARVYLPATALNKIHQGDLVEVLVSGRDKPVRGKVSNIRSRPAFTPYFALNERDRARLMYLTDIELPQDESLVVGIGVEVHLP